MRTTISLCMVLLLSTVAASAGGGVFCEDFRYYAVGIQDDPGGIFRGSLTVEILEPDANGVLQPTGEEIDFNFSTTLLGQTDPFNGQTTNTMVSTDGKIELTLLDDFTIVPLVDGSLGVVDAGSVLRGKGRWNCGRQVAGINPITGEPLSRIRGYDPMTGEPGRADVFVQGRWCDCSGENQQ